MKRRRGLWLFASVTGLILVWALTNMELRGRPRDQIERPAGPSALEEAGQNRASPAHKTRTIPQRKQVSPKQRVTRSKRPSVRGAAEAPHATVPTKKQPTMIAPSQGSTHPWPGLPKVPEAAISQPSDDHTADGQSLVGPPEAASGPVLPPAPPPVLTPPVLLTEPAQAAGAGDRQIILERGQLTTHLRSEAREGRVVLRILVLADGSVARAEIARSSGQNGLDQAAVMAVWSWQFAPATRDGTPIDAWVLVPVRFVIR